MLLAQSVGARWYPSDCHVWQSERKCDFLQATSDDNYIHNNNNSASTTGTHYDRWYLCHIFMGIFRYELVNVRLYHHHLMRPGNRVNV